MDKNNFEQLYDNYTHMILFASSNKLKLEKLHQEVVEIKNACNEILENEDIQYSLRSLKGLKSRLEKMQDEIIAFLFQYRELDDMLHLIDVMIADYDKIDIQIDLYELHGIENDLLGAKSVNDGLILLKSEISGLIKSIDDNISKLNT